MSKKITVKEFYNKYNTLSSEKLKEDYVKTTIKDTYIPFENKVAICEKIVESSYYIKTNHNGIERKKFHVNSPAKYMLYCLNIINNYTTVGTNFTNSLEEFNMMNGCGVIDLIFSLIPEREMKEFRMVLDMVENDVMQNEYETHAFISNQMERFSELANATLSPLVKMVIDNLENIDDKKLEKILNKFTK